MTTTPTNPFSLLHIKMVCGGGGGRGRHLVEAIKYPQYLGIISLTLFPFQPFKKTKE
jgi:hypothetical protein